MAKRAKHPAPRKPVKARGALPAPRVAPDRVSTVWYRRRAYQFVAAGILVVLIVVGVNIWLDQRQKSRARERDIRAIGQFERKLQLLQTPITTLVEAMNEAPTAFLAGTLPPDQYRAQAEGWVAEFQKVYQGLRSGALGSGLDELEEARGSYVQGSAIFVDAAKSLALAARFGDAAGREEAIKQGRNLFTHGSAVLDMGARQLQKLRLRFGLNEGQEDSQLPAVQLPDLELAPATPTPPETPIPVPESPPGG